ncbi:PREDICTED: arginine-glutamic acid dipeptide repeats protein-like [Eufriesea mexicana]|uniref:arginine-glutamic acid dipeptide repeats protein-like n=1 Tax=Eufriesea mexicana TaxID=516756 RepID=UPI00083BAD9D|nr:PREDICTED: arginine-glutamic acid dipeptide repeats protein-like [Eufriesea mexicana]
MGIETELVNQKYVNGVAEIPECRDRSDLDKEYRDFPEEKIWSPREEVNKWVPLYVFMARSVLTFAQESQGVSNRDAMENSCTGYAEQYITDVLHDSEYLPEVALKTLLTKELPRKLVTRWTPENVEHFVSGISRYGKNFSRIQKELLPQKNTKDIVDFYYAWKWSDSAKQLRNCRRRRRPNAKRRFPSIGCIFGELSSPKIVTRSVTAATRLSLQKGDQTLSVANLAKSSRVVRKRRSGSLAVR